MSRMKIKVQIKAFFTNVFIFISTAFDIAFFQWYALINICARRDKTMTPSQKTKNRLCTAAAFLIPLAVMLVTYGIIGIYPFGDKSLLSIDMNGQYISFFSYYKGVFSGENSLFYSFSKTMGGNLAGFSAYYLLSPFNLILLFFDVSRLTEAVLLITLLKIGFCGLTMFLFLRRRQAGFSALIFSTSFALMSYNLVYQQNIMWLDGVILLPLICMGIDLLVSEKKISLYCVSLLAAVAINYYIGFMLCIFSVIYFAFTLLTSQTATFKAAASRFGLFALASVLAGGMSAVVLLPALRSLAGGKAGFNPEQFSFSSNFTNARFLSKFCTGAFDIDQISFGLPNIFFGSAILFLSVYFFFTPKIRRKEKLAAAGVIGILFLSMKVTAFNLIWHGFNAPVWFPYRYSFIFSFFLIFIAYRAFCNLEKRRCMIYFGIILFLFCAALFIVYTRRCSYISPTKICITAAAIILCAVLCFLTAKKHSPVLLLLLLALNCGELTCNAFLTLSQMNYKSRSYYNEFTQQKQAAVHGMEEADPGIYRMEFAGYKYNANDPMLFGYNGLSHYSSSEKADVLTFLKKLGLHNYDNIWGAYNFGATAAADSLLGVKYVLSETPLSKGYSPYKSFGRLTAYENPYALPIGFTADSLIEKVVTDTDNPFIFQNMLWSALSGKSNRPIFLAADSPRIFLNNLDLSADEYGIYFEKIDKDSPGYVEYKIPITRTDTLYAYFTSAKNTDAELSVNGQEQGVYFSPHRNDTVCLGRYQPGDVVTLRLTATKDTLRIDNEYFYYEDLSALDSYCREIRGGGFEMQSGLSTKITGTVENNTDKEYLLLTIPYDTAWQIQVDGQKVTPYKAFDCLTAIHIQDGTHTVTMKYTPAGLKEGTAISVFSALTFAAFIVIKKRKKQPSCRAEKEKA